MRNPYLELHREFRATGAEMLVSSGQACVLYGIAAFSKDGDWIIRETESSCAAALEVLARHDTQYRLGAPLDPAWMRQGWTAHFEMRAAGLPRMRVDICSRPPRVGDVEGMWRRAQRAADYDVVDAMTLVELKKTRRVRDYAIIGALAEATGLLGGDCEMALSYLQDHDRLRVAVERWPEDARASTREAVRLLVSGASRVDVVTALALEQDASIQADARLQDALWKRARGFVDRFAQLRQRWRHEHTPLLGQHEDLLREATSLIEEASS